MLVDDLEPELELDVVKSLNDHIFDLYPQMKLSFPLDWDDLNSRNHGMTSNEKQFAAILLTKELYVYREPMIADCNKIADFFVYNPRTENGKLVEITLLPEHSYLNTNNRKRSILRKRRQIEELSNTGIPLVVLYLEQMSNIRKYYWEKLF